MRSIVWRVPSNPIGGRFSLVIPLATNSMAQCLTRYSALRDDSLVFARYPRSSTRHVTDLGLIFPRGRGSPLQPVRP